METRTRRDFLCEVGKGMVTASIGTALVADMGLAHADAEGADTEGIERPLLFGKLEPLVALMQDNPADKMLPLVVERIQHGVEIRDVVAAAALANARAFGGEDYIGFHAFMALLPALEMSKEVHSSRHALPVLKVLYRSTNQIHSKGGRPAEVLHSIDPLPNPATGSSRDALRDAMRGQDLDRAEGLFADTVAHSPDDAFNDLQALVQDDTDVHRVVMAYRAWDLLGLTGREHAHTTLRQSVRYCVGVEKGRAAHGYPVPGIRTTLPQVIDRHRLAGRSPGTRSADDSWISSFCETLLNSTAAQAADAVGGALAEGFSINTIGEALSMAASQQVLRDPGREQAYPGKPIGSVHGDSVGVHASDSMNAWRNVARVSRPYNAVAGLIVAGYHLVQGSSGRNWKTLRAYPFSEHRAAVRSRDEAGLIEELDAAIKQNDQAKAVACVDRYGSLGYAHRPVFDLLLRYATSEDGSLHAEKYYRTVSEEFGRSRKSYRWNYVAALARVTASEYGKRADGYEQACGLLGVQA